MNIAEIFDYAGQPKERITECNLCGTRVFSLLSRQDRYSLPVWTWLCNGCGLGFISPRMTPSAYAEFYATGKYREISSIFTPDSGDQSKREVAQAKYAERLMDLFQPYLESTQAKGWILDVGGGSGIVSKAIKSRFGFYGTEVIDPSGEGDVAKNFEQYEHEPEWADLVLICQTIDHVLDLKGILSKAHEMLSPDGLLYVDIVDFSHVARRNFDLVKALKVDHPYYLTDGVMTPALQSAGLDVVQRDYSIRNHIGYVCIRSWRESSGPRYDPTYAARLLKDLRSLPVREVRI